MLQSPSQKKSLLWIFLTVFVLTSCGTNMPNVENLRLDFGVGAAVWSEAPPSTLASQALGGSHLKAKVNQRLAESLGFQALNTSSVANGIDSINFFTSLTHDNKASSNSAELTFAGPRGAYEDKAVYNAGLFWNTQLFFPDQGEGIYSVSARVGNKTIEKASTLTLTDLLEPAHFTRMDISENRFTVDFDVVGAKSYFLLLYDRKVDGFVWESPVGSNEKGTFFIDGEGVDVRRAEDYDLVLLAFGWNVGAYADLPFDQPGASFNVSVMVRPVAAPKLESLGDQPIQLYAAPGATASTSVNLKNIGLQPLAYTVSFADPTKIKSKVAGGVVEPGTTQPLEFEAICETEGQREKVELAIETNEFEDFRRRHTVFLECHAPLVLTELWSSDRGIFPHFSPSGRFIAVSIAKYEEGRFVGYYVRILDATNGAILGDFPIHDEQTFRVAWHPGETYIITAVGQHLNRATVWNVQTGEVVRELSLNTPGDGLLLGWSPDGTRLAYSNGAEFLVQDFVTGDTVMKLVLPDEDYPQGIAWSPDGNYFATSYYHPQGTMGIHLIDAATGQIARDLLMNCSASIITWSPDSNYLAVSGCYQPSTDERLPVLWDVATGEASVVLDTYVSTDGTLSWHPSGKMMMVQDGNLNLVFHSTFSGRTILTLPGAWVTASSFSGVGNRLVTTDLVGNVVVYSLDGGP